jgi:uncharacterized membrane protein YqjE
MATENQTSDLGQAIQDVSERASLLVREEIELAKTEVTEKVSKLLKGAVVGIVAGVFALFGLIYLLNGIAWLIWELLEGDVSGPWLGFVIVAGVLFLLGALAGLLAYRFVKRGSPPTPQMATVTTAHPAMPQGPTGELTTKVPR